MGKTQRIGAASGQCPQRGHVRGVRSGGWGGCNTRVINLGCGSGNGVCSSATVFLLFLPAAQSHPALWPGDWPATSVICVFSCCTAMHVWGISNGALDPTGLAAKEACAHLGGKQRDAHGQSS